MGHLGVSANFNIAKNIEIILRQAEKDLALTKQQVNYLSRFTWVGHKKGLNYPSCKCLRCEAIRRLEKR